MEFRSEAEALFVRKSACKIRDNFKHKLEKQGSSESTILRQSHLMAATGIFTIKNFELGALFPGKVTVEKLPKKVIFEKVSIEEQRPVLENFFNRDSPLTALIDNAEEVPVQQLSWEELSFSTPDAATLLAQVGEAIESLSQASSSASHFNTDLQVERDHFGPFPEQETSSAFENQQDYPQMRQLNEGLDGASSVRNEPSPLIMDLYFKNHITSSEMEEVSLSLRNAEENIPNYNDCTHQESIEENMFAPSGTILTPIQTQDNTTNSSNEKRPCSWEVLERNQIAKKYRALFQESDLSPEQFLEPSQLPDTEIILTELLELRTATIKQLMKIVKSLLLK